MNRKVREQPKAKLLAYLTKHKQELSKIFKEKEKHEYSR
jgi:hypothetical protein